MKLRAFFKDNTLITKSVSVMLCCFMLLGIFPGVGINGMMATAEQNIPIYDPNLGTYSESDGVLTATPYDNCGFRGWYDKNGKEVAITNSFTMPAGTSSSDYIPVFYNYDLLENGDFEGYDVGTDLKTVYDGADIWNGLPDDYFSKGEEGDWTKATVTADRAKSGSKSLKIYSRSNTFYRTFYGLEENTQYTVSFYYNLDASVTDSSGTTAIPYLQSVAVFDDKLALAPRDNQTKENFAVKLYNIDNGNCSDGEWKKVSLTFYTNDVTDFKMAILFICDVDASLYLDDLALVKNEIAPPTYANDDFSTNSVANWRVSDSKKLSISASDGKLQTSEPNGNYSYIQSPAMLLKKGFSYEITFKLDLSNVTDEKVQDYDETAGEYMYDENGDPVWDVMSDGVSVAANWINFSLSNEYKTYGNTSSTEGRTLNVTNDTSVNGGATTTRAGFSKSGIYSSSKYEASKTLNCSNVLHSIFGHKDSCYTINYAYDVDPNSILNIKLSFTSTQTIITYLNIRLNGRGTYTIDDFAVAETSNNVSEDIIKDNVKTVGTAIRTSGKQGIRYKTEINKRLLCSDMPLGIRVTEYGTVAIKNQYLNGEELKCDTTYTFDGGTAKSVTGVAYSAQNGKDARYAEDDKTIHFTGVLINIAEKNWNSDYAMRSYVKYVDSNGTTQTMYFDPTEATVFEVSKFAYSAKNKDGSFVENGKTRAYLYNNIISKFSDRVITVKNGSAPINTNYQGIRSTIYHGVTFFPDLVHGRTYTDEEAAMEMDRLVDSKVDNVRTRFASQWMWSSSGWNWNTDKMKAFYKWGKMLKERDITITVQAGWHLEDFIHFYDYHKNGGIVYGTEHSSIPEVHYLHGGDDTIGYDDIYGEDEKATKITEAGKLINLDLTDQEYAHYSIAAARYGEWIKQGLLALKANGVNNVEYVLPFTETGYAMEGDPIHSYAEWTLMVIGLQHALEDAGIRKDYRFIGPSQSIYAYQNRETPFVTYLFGKLKGTEYEDMIDIVSMHQYTRPYTQLGYENTVYDPYGSYAMADANFNYYEDVRADAGVSDKEFWCDEYFAHANDAKWWDNVGMQMVQFAAGLTAGMNNGVNRFLTWQMFDTLWDSSATHGLAVGKDGSGEFHGGVHAVGTCPSFVKADGDSCTIANCGCKLYNSISSYVPRVTYYGINILGKYLNNDSATVFETTVTNDENGLAGIYVSAIKNDFGKTVVLVVNTTTEATKVNIQFESEVPDTFVRYAYDPEGITPTIEATSLPSDTTFTNVESEIIDTLAPRSFAIYVSDVTIIGDDVEMPID